MPGLFDKMVMDMKMDVPATNVEAVEAIGPKPKKNAKEQKAETTAHINELQKKYAGKGDQKLRRCVRQAFMKTKYNGEPSWEVGDYTNKASLYAHTFHTFVDVVMRNDGSFAIAPMRDGKMVQLTRMEDGFYAFGPEIAEDIPSVATPGQNKNIALKQPAGMPEMSAMDAYKLAMPESRRTENIEAKNVLEQLSKVAGVDIIAKLREAGYEITDKPVNKEMPMNNGVVEVANNVEQPKKSRGRKPKTPKESKPSSGGAPINPDTPSASSLTTTSVVADGGQAKTSFPSAKTGQVCNGTCGHATPPTKGVITKTNKKSGTTTIVSDDDYACEVATISKNKK